jgi:hypothetical protein
VILPPYGLSGGSMRFDPDCLVLFVDDDLESIRALLSDSREATNTLPIQVRSRLIHERDHLFRHLSSSYGMVRYGLHSLMVRQFFQMAMRVNPNESMTPDGLLGQHLKDLLRKKPPPEIIQKLSQIDQIRPALMYASVLECMQALDGSPAILDRELCSTGIAVWETLTQALSGKTEHGLANFQQNRMPPESLRRFINPDDPLVPYVKGEPFGAADLLEFFAVMIEFAYLSNQGLGLIESSDLLGVKAYFRVGSAFFGEFFIENMERGEFPVFPVELEAAVDLALSIPLTPLGIQVTCRPLSWYDLHPGWRFLSICNHYKESKRSWTTILPDNDSFAGYDQAFHSIRAEDSDALGWPQLERIEQQWLAFLNEIQQEPCHHPLAIDLRGSGRQRIARHLFEERRTTPYSMFLKRRSGAVDRELFFPAVVSREGMTALGGLHWKDRDGDPTNWDEFLMLTGCRFFAEGFPQHPHIRFDQAKGAAELIAKSSAIFGADQDRIETVLARLLSLDSYRKFETAMSAKS